MSKKAKDEEIKKEEVECESCENAENDETQSKEPTVEDELKDVRDQLLRVTAEYSNFRKRSTKEKEQTYSNAKGNVIAEILPAIDNLERALNQDTADYESLKKGVQMTMDGLMAALEKLGVEAFGEVGEQFDPAFHNAVMHTEDDELDTNVITDVFQKGYKINDRVIRPAMVKTAN